MSFQLLFESTGISKFLELVNILKSEEANLNIVWELAEVGEVPKMQEVLTEILKDVC